jgi:hypothetical protein
MLAWHRDLRKDQVFTSLLPDTKPYKVVGKTFWEALRNGLAHNFRPATIKVEDDEWRFSISSQSWPHIFSKGQPHQPQHWIHLNIRACSERVISQIDAYELELRTSPDARLSFHEKSKENIKPIPTKAVDIAAALRSVLGETHS